MSNILKFPNKFQDKPRYYRIPLYSSSDIELVIFCINAFGTTPRRIILDDLVKMDPVDVMECLDFALESDIIAPSVKEIIGCIRKSVEEVPIADDDIEEL